MAKPARWIDWSTLAPACTEQLSLPIVTGGAGDTCPDAFWVEITHIDDALRRATNYGTTLKGFKVSIDEPGATVKATCESAFTTVAAVLGSPGNWTSIGGKEGFAVWTEGVCQGQLCTQPSTCTIRSSSCACATPSSKSDGNTYAKIALLFSALVIARRRYSRHCSKRFASSAAIAQSKLLRDTR